MQGSLGFLSDERRLNVAITRPKNFLIIVGNSKTLIQSEIWAEFVEHCQKTDCYLSVDSDKENELSKAGFLRAMMNGFDELM